MELFDLIEKLFDANYDFNSISDHHKAKHYFMVQRFMSINFPIQAQMLNKLRINPVEVVNYWHNSLSKVYNKPPKWLYTKTKSDKVKSKEWKPSDKLVRWYCTKHCMAPTDFEILIQDPNPNVITELKGIEKFLEKQSI